MKKLVFSILLSLPVLLFASGNDTTSSPTAKMDIYEKEAVFYLNHLDSFVINHYYKNVMMAEQERNADISDAQILMPDNRDSIYKSRLSTLDALSPCDFTYNRYVSAFIDLYLYKKRELTENCLGLSEYYFPIFEEALDKYDIPLEFKYLAIVESALNVRAKSRAGAAGLWQFMYRTGKYYDLEINSYIDQRYEVYAATDAACRYFRNMYSIYGNWELVIAAYNCGPGNVNKAIRRSGGKKNYWEIRKYLPRETRGYVPAFVAVNYAMYYSDEHELVRRYPDSLDLKTDTLMLKGPFDLNDLSQYFCSDIEQLYYLNPSYKRGILPENGEAYAVTMPIGLMNAYLKHKDRFEDYINNRVVPEEEKAQPRPVAKSEYEHIHVVQSGEVLGVIAESYGVGLSRVKDWNNLYSNRIYPGQKLVIYTDKKVTSQPVAKTEVKVVQKDNPNYKYHVIKSGDTLWDIAKMYDGLTVTELKNLNRGVNYKKLKPGDKLIVASKS